MVWWGWMILGLVLLGAEMGFLDAAFFLVFLGVSALFVGSLKLAGVPMPMWVEWVVFAAASLTSMVFFRKRVYTLVRGGAKGLTDPLIGEFVTLNEGLSPNESTRAEHRGSTWTVRNSGAVAISAGQDVRIVSVDGLVLKVVPGATNQDNEKIN